MIHKRASANAVINKIMSHSKGIGESKTQAKSQSNTIAQNGQVISTKVHSIKSSQNMRSITSQYVNFVKEQYGNRVVEHLNNETMKEFIDYKLLTTSQGTVNTYISLLAKVSDNLNQLGVRTTSRNEITAYRSELRENGNHLQKNYVNRANENPQAILEAMKETPYFLNTSLMQDLGLRADDALNFSKLTLNPDNSIYVTQSKNGLNYCTQPLKDEAIIQRVKEAISNQISVNYGEYRIALKEAVESTGQEWHGVHSMRWDYVQNSNLDLATLSLSLGHSREEISFHYMKKFD
jgi:hypothetical protein